MATLSFLSPEPGGLRLPFRRRRSRIERLRRQALRRGREVSSAARHALEERQLPIEPPDLARMAEQARRALAEAPISIAAPDLGRATAAVRQAVAERQLPVETPEFLREWLRAGGAPAAHQPAPPTRPAGLARLTSPEARPWVIAAAAVAGAAIGLGLGMWLTGRRATARARARELESAADEIKAAWPEVTDDDIQRSKGNTARLADIIRDRTGQDPDTVRERLAGMTSRAEPAGGSEGG